LYFSTTGDAPAAHVYHWDGQHLGVAVAPRAFGLSRTADVDGYARVDDRHFYVSLRQATVALPGLGPVQDEDVAYFDDGVWRLFFDGTAHGLRGPGGDIDAIDVVAGRLYFSTTGSVAIPGVRGRSDDADLYRWNGSSFARVWDASRHGLAPRADVDGCAWHGARRVYLSFRSARTTVPGAVPVRDADVIVLRGSNSRPYFVGARLDQSGHGVAGVDDFDL
jgi:hypothetical protein